MKRSTAFRRRAAVGIVPGMGQAGDRRARVVCGVSGRAVVECSKTLSDLLGAELVLVHVTESPDPRTPALFDPATYRSGALSEVPLC